jgi:hypothetical protein
MTGDKTGACSSEMDSGSRAEKRLFLSLEPILRGEQ